jgi:hypothetical protein
MWKEFWTDGVSRGEKSAQRLFHTFCHIFCQTNNLDISPEADLGNGPVDFKFSRGADFKVLVEIKLSTNSNLVHGYTRQLEIYKRADDTRAAIYLVIDVGSMGGKLRELYKIQAEALRHGDAVSDIECVNALPRASASKRT